MPWPQALDYNEAVQCPAARFRDPELRQSTVRLNALGIPSPHSGNFADVYQMEGTAGVSWAVKCFTREVRGLHERYQAVSEHLRDQTRSFMVEFQYLEGGVRVGSGFFPVVKMRWIEGLQLNQFVAEHADDRSLLERLSDMWLRLGVQLREAQLAHGDLQHGNILLVPSSKANSLALRLIDYDGLWVPALAAKPSGEFGHPNYQHPHRTKSGYGPDMDRFSLLVVYTALRALALEGRALWRRFDSGENLLFRDGDFHEPHSSSLFKRLWTDYGGDVRALAGWLVMARHGPLQDIPALEELVEGTAVRRLNREEEGVVSRLLGVEPEQKSKSPPTPVAMPTTPPPPTAASPRTPVGPKDERPAAASAGLPVPTPEQRRAAAGQYERANQVIATGNYDYGLKLLLSCCALDRGNLIYRQRLRQAEKAKYKDNLRGSWLSWLTTWPAKARLRGALRSGDYVKVLDFGERVMLRNPWDVSSQLHMARAADELGLLDLAVWNLEQARQKDAANPHVNRSLALLYEKRGNFMQAMALWGLVRKARPEDAEAQQKLRDLAVDDTIKRGNYDTIGSPAGGRNGKEAGEKATAKSPPPLSRQVPSVALRPVSEEEAGTAAEPLRRRIDADPTDAKPYLQLAHFYRAADDLDKARAVLREGSGPTGNAFELLVELEDLEIEPFRRDLAIAEERLRADPDNLEMRTLQVQLQKEISTRELDLFRRKADRYPMEVGHRLEVGIRLLHVGQIEEAIRELQGVRSDPRHAGKAAFYLGHCFRARNNGRLAQRNFEEALQNLLPTDAAMRKETLYHLAQVCAEAGDLSHAVDVATDLAHEDFAYRDIGRLLDEWQARLQAKV